MINKCMVLFLVFSSGLFAAKNKDSKSLKSCLSAREYITAIEFLRDFKDLQVTDKTARTYADYVSQGCSGAGQRFIKVATLLTKVGVDSKSALESARSFIHQSDKVVEAFIKTYKVSYEEDFLDLDALSAMRISLSLSSQFKGKPEIAREDFKQLAIYCKDKDKLDLPLPTCAKLATDIALLSEHFNKPIAKSFIDLLEFASQESDGPGLDLKSALETSQELIKYGPKAHINFKQAYKYGVKKSGLGLSAKNALRFAKNIAKRSSKELESPK